MPINSSRNSIAHTAIATIVPSTVLILTFFASGCTKEKLGLKKPEATAEGSIDITAVYPTAEGATWTAVKDGDGRYYLRTLDISVTGPCSETVKKVRVKAGSILLPEAATCTSGVFTWTKTFNATEQGNMNLKVVTLGEGDAPISAEKEFLIRIDTTGPVAPLISFPTSNPYSHLGSAGTATVTGSVSPDTVKLVGPGSAEIVLNGTQWSYDIDLTGGGVMNYSFTAHDFAGNVSSTTTLVASWNADATLKVAGLGPGGRVADAGTGFSLEASGGPLAAHAVDGSTSFRIETGFNNLTNQLRAE